MKMSNAWTLVAVLAASLIAAEANATLQNGLISYWPLNGDLTDSVGSNDGTLEGTDTTEAYDAAKWGDGIDLDGVDQVVNVGNDASLDVSVGNGGTGSLAISAWFRVDEFDKSWQALISKGEGTNYRVARRDATVGLGYAGGSAEGPESLVVDVSDGALHHVLAMSENGVDTELWVDGQLVSTGEAPTITDSGLNLLLGGNPETDPNRSWNGVIDDVAIWNRVLTEEEYGRIWNGGNGASIGSLIPEPSTVVLVGLSAMGLLAVRRKRR